MKIFKITYRGTHTAPSKQDSPMHNLTNTYPDDIYSNNATQYYGDGYYFDQQSINIIQSAKNKPNKKITIYRAVPAPNKEIIQEYSKIINYYNKFGFFPINNPTVNKIESQINEKDWDEKQKQIFQTIQHKLQEIKEESKLNINPGDWVTINKEYAKMHGQAELNDQFKIIQKTVKAKELFSDGNSIHEWGYNP